MIKTNQPPQNPERFRGAEYVGISFDCKVGSNPVIKVDAASCLKMKGVIVGAEKLKCKVGANAPIQLIPKLCLDGGGTVVR